MLIKKQASIASSEITPYSIFKTRRQIIKAALGLSVASIVPSLANANVKKVYQNIPIGPYSANLPISRLEDVSHYNNFYEFTLNKTSSAALAQALPTSPWEVTVEGEVDKPGVYNLEDILKNNPIEERVYRFRCVEGWSMVVPWIGFPLGAMLKKFQPTSRAKYVEFTTLFDPSVMPNQSRDVLTWPYTEGLRIDEAMHPLSFMATGMYDEQLPKQNGAPLRLVVPWKYGFKSIKSIVKIRFLEAVPATAWNTSAPDEYGFFSNVNPEVNHPRWSQATERVLGVDLFTPRRKTEKFNGYGEQVAALYRGMDLSKNY